MYLKTAIVLVSLLVPQSVGLRLEAQTVLPPGCVLNAEGEVICPLLNDAD